MLKIFCGVVVLLFPCLASAADICKAIALRDVAAMESPESVIPRGSYDDAITQYRVNKQTGVSVFCSHGGYCYPTHVRINGQKVEALRLVNCQIGKQDYQDSEETFYSVDVIRSRNASAVLRRDDLDNKFLEMGLCSACADNVAQWYAKQPNSRCAQLASEASARGKSRCDRRAAKLPRLLSVAILRWPACPTKGKFLDGYAALTPATKVFTSLDSCSDCFDKSEAAVRT